MQFLRKFLVFIAAASLISLMFLATFTTVINRTFRPQPIKDLLSRSDVYNTAVDSFLDQAQKSIKDDNGNTLNLADPALKESAKQYITPQYLQSVAENFINGTFDWLDGKSAKPDFVINAAELKNKLASALGAYAKNRFTSLPDCATQAEATAAVDDIMNAQCKPPGVDINAEADKIINELKNNQEFLGDPTITADTLTANKDGGETKNFFDQFSQVPKSYRIFRYTPYILLALLVISALIVIFLSTSRVAGLSRVGVAGLIVGISLIVGVLITNYSYNHYVKQSISDLKDAESLKSTLSTASALLVRDINRTTMIFGILFTALGAAAFTTSIIIKKRTKTDDNKEVKPKDEKPEDQPKVDTDKKPEPKPRPKPAPPKVI